MSIAFKEGLKIPPPAVNEIILAANQDMRQVCCVLKKMFVLKILQNNTCDLKVSL